MKSYSNHELLYAMKKTKLEVSAVNMAELDVSWSFSNLRASFTRVYIPLEGSAHIFVSGERIELEVGRIYVIPYGLSFTCACPEYMKKMFFHFNLRCPQGNDFFEDFNSVIILEDEEGTIGRITELYEKDDVSSAITVKAMLYGIISKAIGRVSGVGEKIKEFSEHTEKALKYIESHINARLTVGEISEALFVSKQVLQKRFKEDVGKPIGRYIDERVMEKAEIYLLSRRLSLSEISEKLGFCDQFYFSRRFTETHGVSPMRFRKMHNV